jgi:hypothetical protein
MVYLEVQNRFLYRLLSLAGAEMAPVEQSVLRIDRGHFD